MPQGGHDWPLSSTGQDPRVRTSSERMEASPERISRHYRSLVSGLLEDYLENFNVIGGGCVRMLGHCISATGRPHVRNRQSQEIKKLSKVWFNYRP